jgi:hypothetical protein
VSEGIILCEGRAKRVCIVILHVAIGGISLHQTKGLRATVQMGMVSDHR